MNLKNIPTKKRVRLFWASVLVTSAVMISASVIVVTATASQTTSAGILSTGAQDVFILALSSTLSVTLCGIAACYALARSGTAAIAALTEKPETFFKAFLVVTLCEAVAIYGLVIAVLLWLRIPA